MGESDPDGADDAGDADSMADATPHGSSPERSSPGSPPSTPATDTTDPESNSDREANPHRQTYVIAGALAVTLVVAAAVLTRVIGTVFFAVTIAYVLYPVRTRLVDNGLSPRLASALTTVGSFLLLLGVIVPFGFALYNRRQAFLELIQSVPDRIVLPFGDMQLTVETVPIIDAIEAGIQGLAIDLASLAAVLSLKLVLFVILLYALLLRPGDAGRAVYGVVPASYHGLIDGLNRRIRDTLYGIYILQAATAAGTFVVALVVFFALGYEPFFTLAVVAGILQFIPVLGPSLIVGGVALVDLLTNMPQRAVLVLVVGGLLIAALPDAVIRPQLAPLTADLPTSLYFIGFVGGLLTVGAIGFVAGPLAIAIIIELTTRLAAAESVSTRTEG